MNSNAHQKCANLRCEHQLVNHAKDPNGSKLGLDGSARGECLVRNCSCLSFMEKVDPAFPPMIIPEAINHPAHYGGGDNPHEAIKCIEAHGLGFHLGNVVKYVLRARKKDQRTELEDLKKARWYLDRKISELMGQRLFEAYGGKGRHPVQDTERDIAQHDPSAGVSPAPNPLCSEPVPPAEG